MLDGVARPAKCCEAVEERAAVQRALRSDAGQCVRRSRPTPDIPHLNRARRDTSHEDQSTAADDLRVRRTTATEQRYPRPSP